MTHLRLFRSHSLCRLAHAVFALIAGGLVLLGAPSVASAACAVPARTPHVFFVTDREAVGDAQLFSGERGVSTARDAVISRGILGPKIDRAGLRSCASPSTFMAALKTDFDAKRGRAVLIYVHGYYTPFRRAAQDALAMQHTLRFNGPVIVYSWPSKVTSRLAYIKDEANAGWSTVHFRELISGLLATYPNMPISFAAHSLGARFTAEGIDFLRHGRCPKCIGRTLLFAPDIDSDTLRAGLVGAGRCQGRPPQSPAHAASVTLYVSNKDFALRQSQRLHGHQRGGQAGNEMLLCNGVDTIDVSYFRGSDKAGHSYQIDPRVVDDARLAFAGVSPAKVQRKLVKAWREGGTYYELR